MNIKLNMMELDINGIWWLPEDNAYFSGTLTFDSQGALLKLAGTFLTSANIKGAGDTREFIILGESIDGKKITLIANRMQRLRESIGQRYVYSETEFEIEYILIGTHFQNADSIKFESVLVQFSNLEKWIHFDLDNKTLSVNIDKNQVLSARSRKSIDIVIDKLCSIKIFSSHEVRFEDFTYSSKISDKVYVKFYQLKNNSLKGFIEVMDTFRDFLNFVFTSDVKTLSFRAILSKRSSTEETCEVLWKSHISSKLEKVTMGSYMFLYQEIKDELDNIVNSWFSFKNELPVVYELYADNMNNSELYITNKFLMIAQAIEAYHGQKFTSVIFMKQNEEVYRKIIPFIEELPNVSKEIIIEDTHKVKTWINNGRKPTLRSRIMQIYATYSTILPYLSIKIGGPKCFAEKVSKYRNGLAHGSLSSQDIDKPDFSWTYRDLHIMLQLCILSQLGFSNNRIEALCHVGVLREIMVSKVKRTIEFFNSNTEKAFSLSTAFTNRCSLPKSIKQDPDFLLRIVEGVQYCIDISTEKVLQLNQIQESERTREHKIVLVDNENISPEFLDKIFLTNRQYMPSLNKKEVIGIALAIWSGCLSAVKILSKTENGGPENEIRGMVFQMIEKLSSERPIYGMGVELALLWKINHGKGDDVDFKEEVIDPHIKKNEKLWKSRRSHVN